MKQITVTLYVSPAAAVRAGSSRVGEHTLTLDDADLAQLTDAQREALARHVGGDRPDVAEDMCWSGPDWGAPLTRGAPPIAEATVDVLKQLLDHRISVVAAEVKRLEKKRDEGLAKRDAAISAWIKSNPTKWVRLNDKGVVVSHLGVWGGEVPDPTPPWDVTSAARPALTREQQERIDARCSELKAARAAAIEAALPEIREKVAANAAKAAAKKAAAAAARDAFYHRLPEALRERDNAGYASEAEIADGIRALCLADAGLPSPPVHGEAEVIDVLTDVEWKALKAARERAPKGATVEPVELISEYRDATAEDDPDDVDSDGEIRDRLGRYALISWQEGGILVESAVPLAPTQTQELSPMPRKFVETGDCALVPLPWVPNVPVESGFLTRRGAKAYASIVMVESQYQLIDVEHQTVRALGTHLAITEGGEWDKEPPAAWWSDRDIGYYLFDDESDAPRTGELHWDSRTGAANRARVCVEHEHTIKVSVVCGELDATAADAAARAIVAALDDGELQYAAHEADLEEENWSIRSVVMV